MKKLPIRDFELGIGVFRIKDSGFKSPIRTLKNANPQFKITNWQFYHHLVIFTFSFLLGELNLKTPFNSVPADIKKNYGGQWTCCPFMKVIRSSWFFDITVQIIFSSAINKH